jgi:tetratricopeptide (TPR) repeat protein
MKVRCVVFAVGICLAAAPGWAIDTVKTNKTSLQGQVTSVSPSEVVLEKGRAGGPTTQIPVNEVVFIFFEDDPASLREARQEVVKGLYEEALARLEKITVKESVRPEIGQDVEFYAAYCRAQMALAGSENLIVAGKKLRTFLDKNKDSYHWFKGNETLGDLYVANGSFSAAEKAYDEVAKAPWADYKMRAGVAKGRALLAQEKTPEAAKAFDTVLATAAADELAETQKMAAKVGKARILALEKKTDDALKLLQPIIEKVENEKTDADQFDLLAHAYATSALAKRMAGRSQEALYDFLRVHLVYPQTPEPHAEALYNLGQLWEEFHKPDRALEARKLLKEQYQHSSWAKKG